MSSEDRDLEITGYLPIAPDALLDALESGDDAEEEAA